MDTTVTAQISAYVNAIACSTSLPWIRGRTNYHGSSPSCRFNAATELVALRTKVGGMATLQKAIVLDSLGYSDDAKKLYKQLRGHVVACE